MKVKRVAQSCPTLSDPVDRNLSGFSIHGIFQAGVLEWGAIAFSQIYTTYVQYEVQLMDLALPGNLIGDQKKTK